MVSTPAMSRIRVRVRLGLGFRVTVTVTAMVTVVVTVVVTGAHLEALADEACVEGQRLLWLGYLDAVGDACYLAPCPCHLRL